MPVLDAQVIGECQTELDAILSRLSCCKVVDSGETACSLFCRSAFISCDWPPVQKSTSALAYEWIFDDRLLTF